MISVPDLLTLDATEVEAAMTLLTQRLREYVPTLETQKRGPVQDIVLHLSSLFAAAWSSVIEDKVRRSLSLKLVAADPTLADNDLVDLLLSNFNLTRRLGSSASGVVTVVVDSLVPVTVPAGLEFRANGLTFAADASYAARTSSEAVVDSTDRLLTATSGGRYAFTINVTATGVGAAGQLQRGTALTLTTPVAHIVKAYVETDFTGGEDADTNATLVQRQAAGLGGRNASNQATIEALVAAQSEFQYVRALSAVGYGDGEQLRYHSIFPVAFGGRVDIYLRSQDLPQRVKLTKTATLVSKTDAGGIWQFSLGRDEAPGFYEVVQVVLEGVDTTAVTGYEVTETIRGYDLTADDTFLPDVTSSTEASFSRFSAATFRFLDTDTDATDLTENSSTADYDVIVEAMPLVKEVQTFLGGRDARDLARDVLVKAAVPCFLSLTFDVRKAAAEADPDLDAIRNDLAAYVNGLGFAGSLQASALAHRTYDYLSSTQTLSAIDMYGRVLRPDGTQTYLRSSDTLTVPDEPQKMVTARTVVFILDPSDIAITVTSGS